MKRSLHTRYQIARLAIGVFVSGYLALLPLSATDDFAKPIRVSPDGRYLTQPDGMPFFWLADTAWPAVMRLNRDEIDLYLKDRAEKGFTVVQAVAYGGPWERQGDPNRYGELPLVDFDPARPNPKYFELVDWLVDRAALHGLRVGLLPVWSLAQVNSFKRLALAAHADGKGRWIPIDARNGKVYARWIGARYKDKGVIWILGGDALPVWPEDFGKPDSPIVDHRPIYDAMAKGILEGAGPDAFITYHSGGLSFSGTARPRTSLYFHDRAWLSMNMIQSSHYANPGEFYRKGGFDFGFDARRNYEPIRAEYDSKPTRPIIDGEARYEDEPVDVIFSDAKGFWKAFDSRSAAYHALFAGAAGHTYGNNSVHQFFDPSLKPATESVKSPWQVELHAPGARQMKHVKALMLSRPYLSRIPDQSAIVGETGEGDAHIVATRDQTGAYMMVYLAHGQAVKLDLTKISGLKAIGWWFNPRTGAAARMDASFPTTGVIAFTPPTSGPEEDWVLVLDDEDRGFAAPGLLSAGQR